MNNRRKLIALQTIILVLVIFLSFLNFIISIIIQGYSAFYDFFSNYFISGDSFFMPYLPYINLGGYLPIEYQIPQLSVGKLIDIIIIINLIWYIQSAVYLLITRAIKRNEIDINEKLNDYNSLSDDNITFTSIYQEDNLKQNESSLENNIISTLGFMIFKEIIIRYIYYYLSKIKFDHNSFRYKITTSGNNKFMLQRFFDSSSFFRYTLCLMIFTLSSFVYKLALNQALIEESNKISVFDELNLFEIKYKRFE
ncbi:MAG: hypothetical protein P8Y23_09920 [Candidatus Lokiarchaeota archaeon]|jgi:hypothetical protein